MCNNGDGFFVSPFSRVSYLCALRPSSRRGHHHDNGLHVVLLDGRRAFSMTKLLAARRRPNEVVESIRDPAGRIAVAGYYTLRVWSRAIRARTAGQWTLSTLHRQLQFIKMKWSFREREGRVPSFVCVPPRSTQCLFRQIQDQDRRIAIIYEWPSLWPGGGSRTTSSATIRAIADAQRRRPASTCRRRLACLSARCRLVAIPASGRPTGGHRLPTFYLLR